MTTTPHPTQQEPVVQSTKPSLRGLVRTGAIAGLIGPCAPRWWQRSRARQVSVSKSTAK